MAHTTNETLKDIANQLLYPDMPSLKGHRSAGNWVECLIAMIIGLICAYFIFLMASVFIDTTTDRIDTLTRSHAVMWERLDKIEADFYGMCGQCHDGVTGATREEQEEMLHKILRGEL